MFRKDSFQICIFIHKLGASIDEGFLFFPTPFLKNKKKSGLTFYLWKQFGC